MNQTRLLKKNSFFANLSTSMADINLIMMIRLNTKGFIAKKITYDRIADEDLRKRFSTKLSIKMVEEWQQQDAYERLMMQEADNAGSEDTLDAETDNHQEKSWNPERQYLLVCFMAICFVIMVHRGIHHGR
ncbi:MAG: hypothetical protein K5678_09440 [Acetatifactor sp.]|nr:hypothetical protein [Acetatifactor sp.]